MSHILKRSLVVFSFLLVVLLGFFSSSPYFKSRLGGAVKQVEEMAYDYHFKKLEIYPSARLFFILPEGAYSTFYRTRFTDGMAYQVLSNVFINSFFQPLFLCIFTPQVVLHYLLLPFFLYGSIRYFKKVPLLIIFFIVSMFGLCVKNAVVETLVRHRMVCDLIYISIGIAGLTDSITRKLF
ncbi:MAG: hypothetical protein WC592_01195 [Candidatus Omnitrophota bacterium]|nr:hypothetical protein [Candidatus Omnitrophota bacterium]